jgi:hypothetical protein
MTEPAKKPSRLKSYLVLGFGTLLAFTATGVVLTEPAFQQTNDLDHLAQEVIINPEVRILTEYQIARNSKLPVEIAQLQAQVILAAATKHKMEPALIVGLIETESLFNATATSTESAKGLMQILRGEDVEVDQEQAYDLEYNVETGIKILEGKLKITNGDLGKSLDNYSGGAENYSAKVYSNLGRYVMFRSKNPIVEIVKGDDNANGESDFSVQIQ